MLNCWDWRDGGGNLVCLAHLLEPDQPNEPDKPDRPNRPEQSVRCQAATFDFRDDCSCDSSRSRGSDKGVPPISLSVEQGSSLKQSRTTIQMIPTSAANSPTMNISRIICSMAAAPFIYRSLSCYTLSSKPRAKCTMRTLSEAVCDFSRNCTESITDRRMEVEADESETIRY